jgi:hypothetical protein
MLCTHGTVENVRKYLKVFRRSMAAATPLQADVWNRVQYRVLPVGYCFYHMQLTDPASIQCPYGGCCAVETTQHALHACTRIRPLWEALVEPWHQFGLRFEWTNILDIQTVTPSDPWAHATGDLLVLWTMLTGGILRRLWLHRNKVKYEGASVPYIPALVELTLLQWSSQVRRHLTLPSTLDDERDRLTTILRQLGQHPNYQGFWTKYPLHLSVNPLLGRFPFR